MNESLKLCLLATAMTTAILISGEPIFARGGAASIMNSPGYQRRLQESRQQVTRPDVSAGSVTRGKKRHRH